MLNPSHLQTLREVARHASFSRAARALHLSQPAVSHHVRHLEEALGAKLLERIGKRAFPTPAGARLLERAERALAELEAVPEGVQGATGVTGRVRVGTGATASIYLLPLVLQRLHRRYPGIDLVIVTGNSDELAADLVDNDLDIGVLTLPVRGRALAVSPYFLDRLVAVTPAEAPWRGRTPRTPADLAAHPLILYEPGGTTRSIIESWFRRAGVAPRIAMELGNIEAIKKLVEAGLGLTIVSAVAVRDEVRRGVLRAVPLSPRLERRLGVVVRRDKPRTPALDVVLAALARRVR